MLDTETVFAILANIIALFILYKSAKYVGEATGAAEYRRSEKRRLQELREAREAERQAFRRRLESPPGAIVDEIAKKLGM